MSDLKNKRRILLATAGLVLVATTAQPAAAQSAPDDVVIMRRQIAKPQGKPPVWVPGEWRWSSSMPACAPQVAQTLEYRCEKDGRPSSACAGSSPVETRLRDRDDGCLTEWTTSDYGDWSNGCSAVADRTRTVTCGRRLPQVAPPP